MLLLMVIFPLLILVESMWKFIIA